MNEIALIQVDHSAGSVTVDPSFYDVRDAALADAALIGTVRNASQQETAVGVQTRLHEIASLVEKSRKAAKQPLTDRGRDIDAKARELRELVDEELLRLSKAIGNFQALEFERAKASEALKNKELSHIERDRRTELACATSVEQVDDINHRYNDKAQVLSAPINAPAKAKGQKVQSDWDITVFDIWLLAKSHPTCVKIEPRLGDIKTLLDNGVTVAGISATRVVKSTVRSKPTKTIEA